MTIFELAQGYLRRLHSIPYTDFSSNKQMFYKQQSGFTLIELLICVAIAGICLGVAYNGMKGNSILPSRESCTSQGGKWTEGIQFGKHTAFCTYN